MKKVSLMASLMLFALFGITQPADSTYYYNNGVAKYVCQQPDVCSFRMVDKSEFTGMFDPSVVDYIEYYGSGDGIHNVYFSATATDLEKEATLTYLQTYPNFEKFFAVATKTSNYSMPYSARRWMATDMQINIIFNDTQTPLADVEAFADEYQMHIVFAPEIDGGVYVLEVDRTHQLFDYYSPTLTLEIARQMWLDHEPLINKVAPSIRIFRADDPNDPLYANQWWAEDGINIECNSGSVGPTTEVSIDLDCAWNYDHEFSDGAVYSGEGIVVGVIDFHGVQWSHPDCEDLFFNGFVAFDDDDGDGVATVIEIFNDGSDVYSVAWNKAHLQNVSGIIGANIDNDLGSAGVAYGSRIIPCLHTGTTAQFNSLLMTLLNETGEEQVDIINMSFGFAGLTVEEAKGFPFHTSIEKCYLEGRDGKGIVLVASAGNSNSEMINIPAAFDEVLSVTATNPIDRRKSSGDGFDPPEINWGGSWFNKLDVAAPGICITSTDFSDDHELTGFPEDIGDGYSEGDYHSFSGTSASAPIVCGIAALVLEKAPDLNNEQVYDAIRLSSEKVGGYSYTTLAPNGRCTELGYGRVNACGALNIIEELGIDEENLINIKFQNPINDFLQISVDELDSYDIQLTSLTGQLIYSSHFENAQIFEIDMRNLSQGIYYLTITDSKKEKQSTVKVIKQ